MFGDNVANVIRDDLISSLTSIKAVKIVLKAVNVLIKSSVLTILLVQTLMPCGHFDFYVMHFLANSLGECCPWAFNQILSFVYLVYTALNTLYVSM